MNLGIFRTILFAAMIFTLGACASKGFNRGDLKEQAGIVKPVFDDQEIKAAFDKKANLPKPFKLAVFFKSPKEGRSENQWRWTEQDKSIFEAIGSELKAQGLVAEVFPLLASLAPDESLKSLRLVAAKHQADALLIVTGATQIDRYTNSWGWSYLMILPALFVSGSKADTLFLSNASLWDVKNEFLYLTAESEATTSETYVAAFGKSDKELIGESKTQALKGLKTELEKMIKGIKL